MDAAEGRAAGPGDPAARPSVVILGPDPGMRRSTALRDKRGGEGHGGRRASVEVEVAGDGGGKGAVFLRGCLS